MERRGEGFERERERYVPERDPDYRPQERERVNEPRPAPRAPEPLVRPSEPRSTYYDRQGFDDRPDLLEPSMVLRARDLTRWGPVFTGFFVTVATMVLLGVLGAAIGLQGFGGEPAAAGANVPAIGAALWGAVTLFVSFFVGGWLAGRTAAIAGPLVGSIHGLAVWGLTVTVLLFLGAIGFASVIGSMMGSAGAPGGGNLTIAQGATWGTFIALTLGLVASVIGGWIGGQNVPAPRSPAR